MKLSETFEPVRYADGTVIGWDLLERVWFTQERAFARDLLPCIEAVMRTYDPVARPVLTLLDVGARCGQGSRLFAETHPASDTWKKSALQVSAVEMEPFWAEIAAETAPAVEYRVGDVGTIDPGRQWDIVVCSHMLEHVPDPEATLAVLRRRAIDWLVVYTPWREAALIPGHYRIDEHTVERLGPDYTCVAPSYGWRHPVDDVSLCAVQVFDLRSDRSVAPAFPAFTSRQR